MPCLLKLDCFKFSILKLDIHRKDYHGCSQGCKGTSNCAYVIKFLYQTAKSVVDLSVGVQQISRQEGEDLKSLSDPITFLWSINSPPRKYLKTVICHLLFSSENKLFNIFLCYILVFIETLNLIELTGKNSASVDILNQEEVGAVLTLCPRLKIIHLAQNCEYSSPSLDITALLQPYLSSSLRQVRYELTMYFNI